MKATTVACTLLICSAAYGQVELRVPQSRYKPHDLIDVAITNTGIKDVSMCVENGQWSFTSAQQIEITPTPVYVQRKTNRGWATLLNGPDIGSMRRPLTIAPGESQHFPFRLSGAGTMRLILNYWIGANDHACQNPKGRKTAKSAIVIIQ